MKVNAATDLENLRGFVREIMASWPLGEVHDMEMELEKLALKYGLIKLKDPPPDKPCGDDCICDGVYDHEDFAAGIVECFERTELLRSL